MDFFFQVSNFILQSTEATLKSKLDNVTTNLNEIIGQLTKAETYQARKRELEEQKEKKDTLSAELKEAEAAKNAAKKTEPQQQELSNGLAQWKLLLPKYDDLSKREGELETKKEPCRSRADAQRCPGKVESAERGNSKAER